MIGAEFVDYFGDYGFVEFGADVSTFADNDAQGLEQFLLSISFEKIAPGASAKTVPENFRGFVKSEQNNFHLRMSVANDASCLDAIDTGHGDIHQDYFGFEFIGQLNGFVAVAGFADELPFGKGLQD